MIDPEIAAFVARMRTDWDAHPPFATLPLAEARAIAEIVRRPWRTGGPVMTRTLERTVETAAGPLPLRIHYPHAATDMPALVYLHGGGFTLFSIDTHDRLMREYAAHGGFVVIGVDYPLSPEHRYPVALDRIVALIDWLYAEGASELGISHQIAIGGDSAGANLSIATSLRLRDRGAAMPCAMLLNYGGFTPHCSDEAERRHGGPGSVMDRTEVEHYFRNYLGNGFASDDPYACPLHADLAGLRPAFSVIGECDILSEQDEEMHHRLRAAGVDATATIYAGATHSFLEAMSIAAIARRAIADGAEWLRARFAGDIISASAAGGAPSIG